MAQPEYALSLTSQFYYCGLPLRLDTYSRCQFGCLYCFARARGGNSASGRVEAVSPSSLARRLDRLGRGRPRSVVDEFLFQRQPIHLGGMSDPLMPIEVTRRTTLDVMKVLADYDYPTVISTKGDLLLRDEYLKELSRGTFVVQVSLSSIRERLRSIVDLGAPPIRRVLRMLRTLSAEGVPTACRIQPLLPGYEEDALEVVATCAASGVRHVAVEHLKLAIERGWRGTKALSNALGIDLLKHYSAVSSTRVGREWVLPVAERLERILRIRSAAHASGLSFGSADNDLLMLGDGGCCCSGIDLFAKMKTHFRYTYNQAMRRGVRGNRIEVRHLETEWVPRRSIARFVNSNSRLPTKKGRSPGIRSYVLENWNGVPNGCSPVSFYGVEDSREVDDYGYKIYRFTESFRRVILEGRR